MSYTLYTYRNMHYNKNIAPRIFSVMITLFVLLAVYGCATPSLIATNSIHQGDLYNNQNNYPEAITHYEEYLRVSPQLGIYRNPAMEADVCRKLAHAYATRSSFQKALSYLEQALSIDTLIPANQIAVIKDYQQLGLTHIYLGNYNQARKSLSHSLQLNEGMETSAKDANKQSVANTYLALAQVELTMGNYSKSLEYAEQSYALFMQMQQAADELIDVLLLKGTIAIDMGDMSTGIDWINQSMEKALVKKLNVAGQYRALGEAHAKRGDIEKGLQFSLASLEEAEKTHIIPMIIWAYIGVGDMYNRAGMKDRARWYYDKAGTLQAEAGTPGGMSSSIDLRKGNIQQAYQNFGQGGSLLGAANASLKIGDYYFQKNAPDSALFYYQEAYLSFEKAGTDEGKSAALLNMIKLHLAREEAGHATQRLQEVEQMTITLDNQWRIWLYKGRLHELSGEREQAIKSYQKAIELIESMRSELTVDEIRSAFMENKREPYEALINLLLRPVSGTSEVPGEDIIRAFNYGERARARTFLDMLGNTRIQPKSPLDHELVSREYQLRLKIHKLNSELKNTGTTRNSRTLINKEIQEALTEHEETLLKLKLEDDSYKLLLTIDPPAPEQVQTTLAADELVLEYWLGENRMFIWAITKKNVAVYSSEITAVKIERMISGFRNGIKFNDENTIAQFTKDLRDQLVNPVGALLEKYTNVTVIPHKSMHFLPFNALLDAGNNVPVTYSPSVAVFYHCRLARPDNTSWLTMALGNLSMPGYSALPGTLEEADFIQSVGRKVDVKVSEEATEAYFKENAAMSGVIHLASHGVLNKINPMYSFVLMNTTPAEDGHLTIREIFDLKLKAQWVTLSACETGMGDLNEGDELVGLSRAFIYAGSGAVIVSLWPVDDVSTANTMKVFYQEVVKGKTLGQSLLLAQQRIRNSKGYSSPYFWAPFILIGNGNQRLNW